MNTTNAAVGTGAIVMLGSWSESKTVDVHVIVGVVFLAFFLSVLPEKIAVPFSWLILAAAAFRYLPGILGNTGLTTTTASTRRAGSDGTRAV